MLCTLAANVHLLSFTLFERVRISRSSNCQLVPRSPPHSAKRNVGEFVAEVNGRIGRYNRARIS